MAEKHLTDGTMALAAQPRVIKIEAAEKPWNAQLRVAAYGAEFARPRGCKNARVYTPAPLAETRSF